MGSPPLAGETRIRYNRDMSPYIEIILKILPIIVLFGAGALMRKIRFFRPETVAELKKLVVNVTLPALLFLAFASMRLEAVHLIIIGAVFAVCVVMLLIGRPLSRLAGVRTPYFPLLLAGFETGMLGYAIFTSVFGLEHIDKLAIIDLGQVLFVFFVLMTVLIRIKGGARGSREVVRLFITSPVIISIFAGIAVSLINMAVPITENPAWTSLASLFTLVGRITTPVIAIVIGFELSFAGSGIMRTVKTILVRYTLLAAAAVLLNRFLIRELLGLGRMYEYALMTMFLLPPPFVISVFMDEKDRENGEYVANTLSISTVVSLGVFILAMLLMQGQV
jgi:malate permease and related proteins